MVSFNLEVLSPNLVSILTELSTNNNIAKYLYYNVENPLAQANLSDNTTLLFSKLYPMPFDEQITTEDCSNVRVYFGDAMFSDNDVVTQTLVIFDIVVAKSLWLMNNGTPQIRPYEIASEVVKTFRNNSVNTVGKLLFTAFRHMAVNQKFDAVRLVAKMTTFSSGSTT